VAVIGYVMLLKHEHKIGSSPHRPAVAAASMIVRNGGGTSLGIAF